MKSFIKNISLPVLMLAALPLFTACSDDKEFGETLFPTEQTDYESAKVYIQENVAAQMNSASNIIITPLGYTIPTDHFEFYVNLSKTADEDITVVVQPDAEIANQNKGDYKVMSVDAFQMERNTVVIKKGERQSEEPVLVSLKDNDAAKAFQDGDKCKMSFTIKEVSGKAKASSNLNKISWYFIYKESNIKDVGSIEGKSEKYVGDDDFSIYNYRLGQYCTTKLTNGNYNDYNYTRGGTEGWRIQFKEAQTVTAIAVYPGYYYGGFTYGVSDYLVYTSDDEENWKEVGTVHSPYNYDEVNSTTPVVAEFYAPVTAKYIKIKPVETYYGFDSYSLCFVSEIELFK